MTRDDLQELGSKFLDGLLAASAPEVPEPSRVDVIVKAPGPCWWCATRAIDTGLACRCPCHAYGVQYRYHADEEIPARYQGHVYG